MGYWYCKAKITEKCEVLQRGKKSFWGETKVVTKEVSRIVVGKVIGIGNVGFYGSHPCYMICTKEGKNPKIENIFVNNSPDDEDGDDEFWHEILELRYVK